MSDFGNVLVTGGLGFIGSAIARRFLAASSRVTIVDSLESNVVSQHAAELDAADIRTCTVEDYVHQHRDGFEHDLIVHSASYVGPAGILKYSGRIAPETLSTTSALAEACIRSHTPMVFISSSEVYGINGTLHEDMETRFPATFNPRLEYALAKLTSEAILTNCHNHGLESVTIRPFNVVGARQSRLGGFVLPTFVQQALSDQPLTVFDTGEQQRAFVCADDLARFVVDYLDRRKFGKNPRYNVGNPQNACTINQLAEKVVSVVDSKSTIEHVSSVAIYGELYTEATSRIKLCDIRKAQSLGWSPARSLDDIILDVADYFREHRDIRDSDARPQSN